MTINLSSTPGGLFRILGKAALALADANAYQSGTLKTDVTAVGNQFVNTGAFAHPELVAPLLQGLTGLQGAAGGIGRQLQSLAQKTLIQAVQDDNPQSTR